MDRTSRLSIWLRLLAIYLGWTGVRAIYATVLGEMNPELQLALERGFGPAVTVGQTLYGVLAVGAAVAIWQRIPWAVPLTLVALALDASLTWFGVLQFIADPAAVREAYAASRVARGVPVSDERLDVMFSPSGGIVMAVIAAFLTVAPLAILLWRRHELAPDPGSSSTSSID